MRPEPSRGAASPSITAFPPLRQLYRPFLHWPIGPQNPVPSTTAISRHNHRAPRSFVFSARPSARTMTTDVTLSLSARYFFLCSNSFTFLSDHLVGYRVRSIVITRHESRQKIRTILNDADSNGTGVVFLKKRGGEEVFCTTAT